tara:strand:+ start:1808 stop:2644 length:837 start_codon:yes stop_codon:yes gene_type:complete
MKTKKIWFIGVTHEGNAKHLKELIDPIKDCFDGLIWTFHYPLDDGYDYLESVKGEGEIIKSNWCNRLDYSRNHCLYQGPMQIGDWFFTVDCHERMSRDFAQSLRTVSDSSDENGIDGIFLHGKRFAAKLKEETEFSGNPHEGIRAMTRAIEITKTDYWKDSFFKNIRQDSRDKFAIFMSAMKYYIFPQTNHLLLHFENDRELVRARYKTRSRFLSEITRLGYNPYCLDSVKSCIQKELTEELRECINSEKILNDWYRYEFLGARDLIDQHDFKLIKQI